MTEVRYLTDDRDYPVEDQCELVIFSGGNGDWYVQVTPVGSHSMHAVRLCTSGGASNAAPGLTNAIAEAYRCIKFSNENRRPSMSESYDQLKEEVAAWRAANPSKKYHPLDGVVDSE